MQSKLLTTLTLVAVLLASLASGWWALDLSHDSIAKIPSLHGLTPRQVTARLGQPDHQTRYTMARATGEFRVELFNTYPPGAPGNATVHIIEMRWDHVPYHVAVWFHRVDGQWVALDTCRWKRGIRF